MIAEELDRLHKQACLAIDPLTTMMVRRKYSPAVLKRVAEDLQNSVRCILSFLEES